jgi:hypothetical protein
MVKIYDYCKYIYYTYKNLEMNDFNNKIDYIDLSQNPKCPGVYSQGELGSCVVNSFCFILKYKLLTIENLNKEIVDFKPSRYYLYHYCCFESYGLIRFINFLTNTEQKGGGGTCKIMLLNSINTHGILKEQFWEFNNTKQSAYYLMDPIPIDNNTYENLVPSNNILDKIKKNLFKSPTKFNITVNKQELEDAKKWKYKIIIKNIKINKNIILQFIHHLQNNRPIMFFMSIDPIQMHTYMRSFDLLYYDYNENPKIINYDPKVEFKMCNLHAMVIVGYNNKLRCFKILNSWGYSWGYEGYCFMSYDIFDIRVTKTHIITSASIIDRVLI